MPKCWVPGCPTKAEDGIRMFSFPRLHRSAKWVDAINKNTHSSLNPSEAGDICILHFRNEDFTSPCKDTLTRTAVPSVFPLVMAAAESEGSCVYPGCTNSTLELKKWKDRPKAYHEESCKRWSSKVSGQCSCVPPFDLFRFPMKNEEKRKEWIRIVRGQDWEPDALSFVCSEHFRDGEPTEENPCPVPFEDSFVKSDPIAVESSNVEDTDPLEGLGFATIEDSVNLSGENAEIPFDFREVTIEPISNLVRTSLVEKCFACSTVSEVPCMYPLRLDREYLKPWLVYCGRLDVFKRVENFTAEEFLKFRVKTKLCSKHFSPWQFGKKMNNCLLWSAYPDVIETMPAKDLKSVALYKQILLNPKLETRLKKLDAIMNYYCGLTHRVTLGCTMNFGNRIRYGKADLEKFTPWEVPLRPLMDRRTSPTIIRGKDSVNSQAVDDGKDSRRDEKEMAIKKESQNAAKAGLTTVVSSRRRLYPELVTKKMNFELPLSLKLEQIKKLMPDCDDVVNTTTNVKHGNKRITDFSRSPFYALWYSLTKENVSIIDKAESKESVCKSYLSFRMKSMLHEAFENSTYADVTVVCGNQYFKAHKMVLSAFSSFLRELFLDPDSKEDTVLILDNYDEIDVANALGFLYNGVILVDTIEDLGRLQRLLDDLQVKPPTRKEDAFNDDSHVGADTETLPDQLDVGINRNSAKRRRRKSETTKNVNEDESQCFICQICSYQSRTFLKLRNHCIKSHDYEYLCAICLKPFHNKEELNSHLESDPHDSQRSVCDKCGATLLSHELRNHELLHEHGVEAGSANVRTCRICKKSVNPEQFLQHMKGHTDQFQCRLCTKGFSRKRKAIDHEKLVHKIEEGGRFCYVCMKTFSSPNELKHHRISDPGKHILKCPVCNNFMLNGRGRHSKGFGFRTHLRTHAVEKLASDCLTCPVCKRSFDQYRHLCNHYASHLMPGWRFSECSECFWGFDSVEAFNEHSIICAGLGQSEFLPLMSKDPLVVFCDPCLPRVCPGPGPNPERKPRFYKCKKCNIKFPKRSELRRHDCSSDEDSDSEIIFSDFEPMPKRRKPSVHRCENCDIVFSSEKELKEHHCDKEEDVDDSEEQKSESEDETQEVCQWKCENCDTIFSSEKELKEHHCDKEEDTDESEGEKSESEDENQEAWQCSECSAVFLTQSNCEAHIQSKHN